jgi:glycogen operon protein
VSYDTKHNEANHELNSDGTNANLSWNCGVEGPSNDPKIEQLRERQIKNLFALTLFSIGTPMLLMGDEVRRTQGGNNNAYCQNNETSWFDWALCETNASLLRFVRQINRARLYFNDESVDGTLSLEEYLTRARIEWHGVELGNPDWSSNSHSIALTMRSSILNQVGYIAINSYWEALEFALPPLPGGPDDGWLRLMDTSLPSPEDIVSRSEGVLVRGATYVVNPRSIIMLHCANAEEGKTNP